MLTLCLITLQLTLASGCTSYVPAAANAASPKGPVEITLDLENDTARFPLGESKYRIRLREINDSRCPANAKCIWQGELAAELTVDRETSGRKESKQFTLGQLTTPSITVIGASFDLVSISEKLVTIRIRTE
jgi:hypothetical protein